VLVLDAGSSADGATEVVRRHVVRIIQAGEHFASTLRADEAAMIENRFAVDGESPLVRPGERLFDLATARDTRGRWLA